jgi:uncharacterized protein YcbX
MQTVVGRVESLWRYPVKSMRGEELKEAFAGFPGIYGDRMYAFRSSAAPKGFPYLTAREQRLLLRCRPAFRNADRMKTPSNLAEAEALEPGVAPLYAEIADLMVDVETPSGDILAIDDTRLIDMLAEGKRADLQLSLIRSERALTDCHPVSLISIQTTRQVGQEVGAVLDKRRFRANVYVDLTSDSGFRENEWVGHRLRIGAKAELAVMDRDTRCKMITLDPDTAEANPEVIRRVTAAHEGTAGVYAAVMVEGTLRTGDSIALVD